jgi:hypothetical protein
VTACASAAADGRVGTEAGGGSREHTQAVDRATVAVTARATLAGRPARVSGGAPHSAVASVTAGGRKTAGSPGSALPGQTCQAAGTALPSGSAMRAVGKEPVPSQRQRPRAVDRSALTVAATAPRTPVRPIRAGSPTAAVASGSKAAAASGDPAYAAAAGAAAAAVAARSARAAASPNTAVRHVVGQIAVRDDQARAGLDKDRAALTVRPGIANASGAGHGPVPAVPAAAIVNTRDSGGPLHAGRASGSGSPGGPGRAGDVSVLQVQLVQRQRPT